MTDVTETVEVNEVNPNPEVAATDKLVPVTEAIRYRKRAQAAEQQLESTRSKLDELASQLDEAQQTIGALERRQRIDAMLAESDVVDMEAARLLTERAVLEMDEPDVKLAVQDLQRCKPYLFRRTRTSRSISPAVEDQPTHTEHAAAEARASGDRRDLLRYLRLRRKS
ncbi:MAG: hypothetical protein IT445_12740 [Phycisphaeraceae bacterium]|nr:hypothetical protein [Phycisphaeraceae bacterium]